MVLRVGLPAIVWHVLVFLSFFLFLFFFFFFSNDVTCEAGEMDCAFRLISDGRASKGRGRWHSDTTGVSFQLYKFLLYLLSFSLVFVWFYIPCTSETLLV